MTTGTDRIQALLYLGYNAYDTEEFVMIYEDKATNLDEVIELLSSKFMSITTDAKTILTEAVTEIVNEWPLQTFEDHSRIFIMGTGLGDPLIAFGIELAHKNDDDPWSFWRIVKEPAALATEDNHWKEYPSQVEDFVIEVAQLSTTP